MFEVHDSGLAAESGLLRSSTKKLSDLALQGGGQRRRGFSAWSPTGFLILDKCLERSASVSKSLRWG